MKSISLGMLMLILAAGCGREEEAKPNPLQKADVPLPVLTMPTGQYPPNDEKIARPLLKEKIPVETEVAIEGVFEVADPETFEPTKMSIRFLMENKGRRIIKDTHRGGLPVRAEGNQYRYRSATKVPEIPRRFTIEVFQGRGKDKAMVATAEVQVVEAKKEDAKK